jgi:hypothetical protein
MDALAPLLPGKGVDHQGGRTHQTLLHGTGGLDREPLLQQWRIQTAANVGEACWEPKRLLGAIPLDLPAPPGRPHRQVGPPSAPELCVGAGHFRVQPRQGPPDSRRERRPSPCGGFGEALGERAVPGGDQGCPRNRLGPWAHGRRVGDELCHLQARSSARQPRLKVA